MAKKREIRLKVQGVRRKEPDTRKMARAIVRLAVTEGAAEAQDLADALEHEEKLHRTAITRARKAERAASEGPKDQTRRRAS